jgi:hypothetical protein
MMTPYILLSQRVLVVTPSRLVRNQIAEDFRGFAHCEKPILWLKARHRRA